MRPPQIIPVEKLAQAALLFDAVGGGAQVNRGRGSRLVDAAPLLYGFCGHEPIGSRRLRLVQCKIGRGIPDVDIAGER